MEKKNNDGFSLVEVIIALSILAILSLPLLSYFTNASISASKGKDMQKASLAAQSVTEELSSYTKFDQIEALNSKPEWSVVSGAAVTELAKNVTVDGTLYQTRVKVDYDYTRTDSNGDTTASKYNEYDTPELAEVYSSYNAVFAESDQLDTALSSFFYKDTSVSKSQILAGMSRKICLDIAKDAEDSQVYVVKVYYIYNYNGDVFTASVKETKIESSKLQNVYLFYHLLREDITTEMTEVNFDNSITMAQAQNVKLYFVCQSTGIPIPAGYSLNISGSGNYLQPEYFTNGIPSSNVSVQTSIVSHKKEKRIAAVTVDVYSAGETSFNDETRLARLRTSKGA